MPPPPPGPRTGTHWARFGMYSYCYLYISASIHCMAWLVRGVYGAGYIHNFGLVAMLGIWLGVYTSRQPYHVGMVYYILMKLILL